MYEIKEMLKSLNEDEGEKGVNDMTRLKFNYYIVI